MSKDNQQVQRKVSRRGFLQTTATALVGTMAVGDQNTLAKKPLLSPGESSLVLGRAGAPPCIVNTSDTLLANKSVERLAHYIELCLGKKPEVLSSIPAGSHDPLIVIGTSEIAWRYKVALPPLDSEEAYSLATLSTSPLVVVVSGATDKGIKRAIHKLILLSQQKQQELLLPSINISTSPWQKMREYTLANWRPDNVRIQFTNRLADKRVDIPNMDDATVSRYVQIMDEFGFSGVQVSESCIYWSSTGSMEVVQEEIRKVAKAAHEICQHVSYLVYGAEFTSGWIDPEVTYTPAPGKTAFDDPLVRRGFEKYYNHYAAMGPFVDMVIGHWFDAGRLTDLGDVINYQKLLAHIMLEKNSRLTFAINGWGNLTLPAAVLESGMTNVTILELSMPTPSGLPMEQRVAFRREAMKRGFKVGIWGWYMTEYETDQIPNMYVNGHVLKEYINNQRNGVEKVLPSTYWSEMDAYHINNMYSLYQAAQLLWDPDRDPDEILMEIVDGVWGPVDGPAVYGALKLIEDVRSGPTWATFSYLSEKRIDGTANPADDLRRAQESLDKLASLKPDKGFIPKFTLPVSREALLELMMPHLEQIRLFAEFRVQFKKLEELRASAASKEVLTAKIVEVWRPIPEFNTWIGTYGQAEAWSQEKKVRKFCAESGIVPPVPKWKASRDRERVLEAIQSRQRVSAEPTVMTPEQIASEFSMDKDYMKSLFSSLVEEGWLEHVQNDQYQLRQWREIAFPARMRFGLHEPD